MKVLTREVLAAAVVVATMASCSEPVQEGDATGERSEQLLRTESDLMDAYGFPRTVSNVPYPGWDLYVVASNSKEAVSESQLMPIDLMSSSSESEHAACLIGMILTDLVYLSTVGSLELAAPRVNVLEDLIQKAGRGAWFSENGGSALTTETLALQAVNALYIRLYEHLQAEGKMTEAALMLAGSWVQAEHISLSLAIEANNSDNEFFEADHGHLQFEQKTNLFNLMQMVESTPGSPTSVEVLGGLNLVYDVYGDILSGDDVPEHLNRLLVAVKHIRDGMVDGFAG